mgnify:FL=1
MQNNNTTIYSNQTTTPTWEYHIIAERCIHPDIGVYRSYGIHAFEIIGKLIRPIAQMHDITTIQEEVETLVQLCNAYQLSPVHLSDVVADFIEKTS